MDFFKSKDSLCREILLKTNRYAIECVIFIYNIFPIQHYCLWMGFKGDAKNFHLKHAFSSTAFDTVLTCPLKVDENMRQEITEIWDTTSNNSIFCPGCPALILWCHHRSVFCLPITKILHTSFLPFIFASKKLYIQLYNDPKRDCKRGEGSGFFLLVRPYSII